MIHRDRLGCRGRNPLYTSLLELGVHHTWNTWRISEPFSPARKLIDPNTKYRSNHHQWQITILKSRNKATMGLFTVSHEGSPWDSILRHDHSRLGWCKEVAPDFGNLHLCIIIYIYTHIIIYHYISPYIIIYHYISSYVIMIIYIYIYIHIYIHIYHDKSLYIYIYMYHYIYIYIINHSES